MVTIYSVLGKAVPFIKLWESLCDRESLRAQRFKFFDTMFVRPILNTAGDQLNAVLFVFPFYDDSF